MTATALPTGDQDPFHSASLHMHGVLPGEHKVVRSQAEAVSTLLGSCVAACIRDRKSGIGGLNHFLLPGDEDNTSARYGAYAMEVLVNEILSLGAARSDLEAKVFGGGAIIASSIGFDIGRRNGEFVKTYLSNEGIRLMAEDLGGDRGRRLNYHPATGQARVQYLGAAESRRAADGEAKLDQKLAVAPKVGIVELFG